MTENNLFQNAQNFVVNHSLFNQTQAEKQGLRILLRASIPAAAYDSSEHPLHCHPGTRHRYIDQILNWGSGGANRDHRIFWLKGPAGVGKSAIAQSCAEELAAQEKLAAAFFFSRSNRRDKPQRLFTSISYQWASKRKPYAEILKSTIHDDPTIVNKEPPHQFHHLFVLPLQELIAKGEDIPERVIIIDGLDECAGAAAQQAIVEIIAASTRNNTTPFVWLFCSRLEPHLITTFNSPEISEVTHQEELTVSRAIDNEITKYFMDELLKIGREHDLPLPWPRERDIGTLINLSSGLFIYASTVVRFIGDRNSLGPESQLRAVLALATTVAKGTSDHPLSELDLFYLLIMQRIPAKILQTVQWIILAMTICTIGTDVEPNRQLVGLSPSEFRAACRTLHSVMKLDREWIVFYHTSFMDFMQDPRRSRQFCIWLESGLTLQTELMQRLQAVCNDDIVPYSKPFCALIRANRNNESQSDDARAYENIVIGFLYLSSVIQVPWGTAAFTTLASFNFKQMAELWFRGLWVSLKTDTLFSQIPEDDRGKIIQSCKDRNRDLFAWEVKQKPSNVDWDGSYILGHGQERCFLWYDRSDGTYTLRPYQKCPPTQYPTDQHSTTDCTALECLTTKLPAVGRQAIEHQAPDYPTTEYPTTELHVFEHPSIEYPTIQDPTTDYPTTDRPNIEFPIIENATAGSPVTSRPAAERPVSDKAPHRFMVCVKMFVSRWGL